jgi:hypothetical protein
VCLPSSNLLVLSLHFSSIADDGKRGFNHHSLSSLVFFLRNFASIVSASIRPRRKNACPQFTRPTAHTPHDSQHDSAATSNSPSHDANFPQCPQLHAVPIPIPIPITFTSPIAVPLPKSPTVLHRISQISPGHTGPEALHPLLDTVLHTIPPELDPHVLLDAGYILPKFVTVDIAVIPRGGAGD